MGFKMRYLSVWQPIKEAIVSIGTNLLEKSTVLRSVVFVHQTAPLGIALFQIIKLSRSMLYYTCKCRVMVQIAIR